MSDIPWKQMYGTVSINLRDTASKKEKKLIDLVNQKTICAQHILNYRLQPDQYRLYSRGKNRCSSCGVKTSPKTGGV